MNRDRIADYLDGLLDGGQAREVQDFLRDHPEVAAEAHRLRGLLRRPWPIPPPAADLRDRILRRRRRTGAALLRYAAAFLAGVLVTLLVQSRVATPPTPGPAKDTAELVYLNSRIR